MSRIFSSLTVSSLTVATALLAGVGTARAQGGTQLAERAPRFLLASTTRSEPVPLDVRNTPLLRRRIALDLRGATLERALDVVARQTGLRFAYSHDAIALAAPVTLRADDITVAAALTEILLDAGVDVVFSPGGQTALVRRPPPGSEAQGGTVTGRVTDATSQQGVANVRVFLDRTRWGTTTDSAGSYRLTEVAPGAYTLVARRIGYGPQTRRVTVEADRETTVDVALQAAPSDLEAVVVTATGEQRLLELGHVVGRINADSVVREAPVTSVSELLTARVPGLQVYQTQGTVGGKVNLQIRGPTSISVSNEPIVVIDGVRYTTDQRRSLEVSYGLGAVEAASPLNDLNPNDIESIEVVKGPAAATLYGTDAANGVIVITTKRGRPGPARWDAYAKMTTTEIPTGRLPDIYWGWGTVSGVPDNPNRSCTLARLASGQCTQQDSVTVIRSGLRNPEYSILAAKPTAEYGVNLAGGAQDLRYYFSGAFTDATGAVQMPSVYVEALKERLGLAEVPREWREPNALTNLNLRSNVTAVLGRTMQLRLSTGYIRSSTRALSFVSDPYERGINRATPADPGGYAFRATPDEAFAQQSTDRVDRFAGSAVGDWRPAPWLSIRATLGLDLLGSHKYAIVRPGDQPNRFFVRDGMIEDSRTRQLATTADVGVLATARRGGLSARTGVGVQYVHSLYDASGSFGNGLAPGQSVVPGAIDVFSMVSYSESAILGGYIEEVLGLNDRLFLTGAVRVDGASAFGRDFQATAYPKVGASWLVSAEPFVPRVPGLDELRVRVALGAAGRQPDPAWARPGFTVRQLTLDGRQVNAYEVLDLGNPDLRPERTREREFGVDVSAFESRLALEVTWFGRRTTDQLVTVPSPPGFGSRRENLGLTTQSGFEARISALVVETRAVSLDVALQHSNYGTNLVDIGRGVELLAGALAWGGYREGYPLGARFLTPIVGWDDLNGDGILEFNEVVFGDSVVYMGQSFPPQTQTLSAALGLLDGRVRVSALLERKSGFTHVDPYACFNDTCRALVDRNTPLEAQAQAMLSRGQDMPQTADFVRLREVSLALDLPRRLTRTLRLSRGTLVVSGRNLALWSKFGGTDPEVTRANDFSGSYGIVGGGAAYGIPLGRVLSVRLDLGF